MHRPQRHQLTKTNVVDGVGVPEPHRQYTSVVGELEPQVALCGLVLLTWFRDVGEVHDAARESKVARAG